MEPQFGRLITAMVTPFSANGEVNISEALRLAHFLVDNGSDTVLLAGTTGESPTLTHSEEFSLFKETVAALKGKAFVMAGTGSNSTRTAIESTQKAEQLGVDVSLQVVPYYNRPSQEGLFQHFKTIAQSTSLPIVLYNIPSRTGRNLEPETVARLASISNIIGIKEAAGSVDQVKALKAVVPASFAIYSGDDALTLPFMEEGACGVISVASHCSGLAIKDMIDAFVAGNKSEAYRLNEELKKLFEVLFITTNPTPVKAALQFMGFEVGGLRLPLIEATDDEKKQVEAVLRNLGLLS